MGQPALRTSRLTLVPLADEHLEDEIALDAEPAVMRYLDQGRPRTRNEVVAAHRRRMASGRVREGLGMWSAFSDGGYIGWFLLDADDAGEGEAELGYRLRPEFWRQGLAREGSLELLRHGFEDLNLSRIYAQTMAVNEASRATMASVGMTYARTFHLQWEVPLPGTEHGEVEYEITRANWISRK